MTSQARAAVFETVDDARFLLMRAVRLVIGAATEVAAVLSLVSVFGFPMCYAILHFGPAMTAEQIASLPWHQQLALYHPWYSAFVAAVMFTVFFAVNVAVITPYRYAVSKPGLNVRTCGTCGVQVPDYWFCQHCRGFRYVKIASSILYALSLVVTVIGAAHDILAMVLFVAY